MLACVYIYARTYNTTTTTPIALKANVVGQSKNQRKISFFPSQLVWDLTRDTILLPPSYSNCAAAAATCSEIDDLRAREALKDGLRFLAMAHYYYN